MSSNRRKQASSTLLYRLMALGLLGVGSVHAHIPLTPTILNDALIEIEQAQAAVCAVMLGELDKAAEMAALMRSDLPDHVNVTTLDIRWSIARVDAAVGERGRAVDELTAAAADARALGLTYSESVLLAALCHACAADRAVGRLAELVPLVDGHLIHLRHAAAEALVGRGDPDTVLAELDRRGLVFEATSVRAALDTHPT